MSKSGKAGPEPGYRPSAPMRTAHGGSNAGNAAGGAATIGATAGTWGLVRDGSVDERALAGAAASAAAGSVRGMMQSSETSPVFRNFVQKCLHTGVMRSSAGSKHRPRA